MKVGNLAQTSGVSPLLSRVPIFRAAVWLPAPSSTCPQWKGKPLKHSEALTNARGHIAWILALVLSTTAVIYLERLDINAPAQPRATSAALAAKASEALRAAEELHAVANDARSAAALALTLVAAVQAGALDVAEGQERLAPLRDEAALTPYGPVIEVMAELTFGE